MALDVKLRSGRGDVTFCGPSAEIDLRGGLKQMNDLRKLFAKVWKDRLRSSLFLMSLFLSVVFLVSGQNSYAGQVTLAWNPSTDSGLAGYQVYYGTASGDYSRVVDVGMATRHTLTGLLGGETYYFAATVYNGDGHESVYSDEVVHTTPVELAEQVTVIVYPTGGQGGGSVREADSRDQSGVALYGRIVVGDDARNRQTVGIVSFDTSVIPTNARIIKARLRLDRVPTDDSDPFSLLGGCLVDVMKGTFNDFELEPADFEAPATAPKSGSLFPLDARGLVMAADLNDGGLSAINRDGSTQIRLRFRVPTNGDWEANRASFYSGTDDKEDGGPSLRITYITYLP
jgi:hypothetical protein